MKFIIDDNYFCDAQDVSQVKYINNDSLVIFFKNNENSVHFNNVKVEIIDSLYDFLTNDEKEFDVRNFKKE